MSKFIVLVFISVFLGACASDPKDELGYDGFNRGGETVEETLSRLREDPSVSIRNERGWTVATKESGRIIWSFTPTEHPAHPSFVKREVIEKDGSIYIDTSARCGAQKSVCDQLVQDFVELNNNVRKQMSGG